MKYDLLAQPSPCRLRSDGDLRATATLEVTIPTELLSISRKLQVLSMSSDRAGNARSQLDSSDGKAEFVMVMLCRCVDDQAAWPFDSPFVLK